MCGAIALAGAMLLLSPVPVASRTWSSNGYGDVTACLDDSRCMLDNTTVTLVALDEYDSTGASGSYHYSMSDSDTALAFGVETNGTCSVGGTCTTRASEAAVPNGGVMYSTPAVNGDPVMRYSVLEVESGVVNNLVGGVNAALSTSLTSGDMMFVFEFEDWALGASDSVLNFTFRIDTVTDGNKTNSVYAYNASADIMRLVLSSGVYVDLPTVSNASGSSIYTSVGYSQSYSYIEVEVSLPASSLVKYSFAMWFVPLATTTVIGSGSSSSSGWSTISLELEPLSVLNLFSGGFEYCAAANCNINTGVLSMALDRLGMVPTLTNTLAFNELITDFTDYDSLPFADPVAINGAEGYPLIIQISETGGANAITDTNAFLADISGDNTYVVVMVSRLEEESSMTSMGETLTAPAGALQVSVSGFGFSNRDTSLKDIGLSFYMFSLEDGGVVKNASTASIGMYTRRMNISDMYLLYSLYGGVIDGHESQMYVQSHAYNSGDNEGLIQLLLEFKGVADTFTFEFFLGSENIEYGGSTTDESATGSSMSGSQATVDVGTSDDPVVSWTDGMPIVTKMLSLPHGEFGLCFDASCSTSAVKIGFSGLASSEGNRLGRFSDAAAFVFSQPEHTYLDGNEVLSMSFIALVPQSRIRPPIPYTETLAASYPSFYVRVDQFWVPGRATNAGRTLPVPRGALKFSFSLSNWQFQSPTDKIILNATLSSIIGDVPGATGVQVSTPESDLLRISFGDDQFLDIPLLAEFDGGNGNVSITSVVDADVGIVLVMEFGYFSDSLVYDPVLASQALVLQDVGNRRWPVDRTIIAAAAITLTAILGLMIIASVIRCLRKVPVKADFHGIFF